MEEIGQLQAEVEEEKTRRIREEKMVEMERQRVREIENELASMEERLREVMQDNFILAEEVKRVEQERESIKMEMEKTSKCKDMEGMQRNEKLKREKKISVPLSEEIYNDNIQPRNSDRLLNSISNEEQPLRLKLPVNLHDT